MNKKNQLFIKVAAVVSISLLLFSVIALLVSPSLDKEVREPVSSYIEDPIL